MLKADIRLHQLGKNMKNKTKTIKIKQSMGWNFAFYYLQSLYDFPEIINDEIFCNKFEELFNYVSDKISTPNDDDITDIYVILEQKVKK